MPSKNKQKGNRYERYIAKLLSKVLSTNIRRTPNSGALGIRGDLRDRDSPYLSGPLAGWVLELKKQEKTKIWEWIKQAENEAGSSKWALIFSKNREKDYVILDINDWLELLKGQK